MNEPVFPPDALQPPTSPETEVRAYGVSDGTILSEVTLLEDGSYLVRVVVLEDRK